MTKILTLSRSLRLPLALVAGFALGYFLMPLIPLVLTVFLLDWWTRLVGSPLPHREQPTDCDPIDIPIEPIEVNGHKVTMMWRSK